MHFLDWEYSKNFKMGKNNYFQFKRFKIIQEQAAMKVGTDGVLLGAWADITSAKTILDIGTGTGVIALMMAQRSNAKITGIEIEKNASEEASKNILNSPWSQRINIINTSLQCFDKKSNSFDLIISNPPYFANSQKSKCELLAIAKHNYLLPPIDFITCSCQMLNPKGKLAVILPAESAGTLIRLAEKNNLFLQRETEVRPNYLKKSHRYLLEFNKIRCEQRRKDVIIIHNEDDSDFTEKYKSLTKDFYLNF